MCRTSTSSIGCSAKSYAQEGCGGRVAASRAAPSDSTARRCSARGWLGTAGWAVLGPGVHARHSGPVQHREVVAIIV